MPFKLFLWELKYVITLKIIAFCSKVRNVIIKTKGNS